MSYTKFIILAEKRTGSVFLNMLLNSHSKIACFGELFNPSEKIRNKAAKGFVGIKPNENPQKYLEAYIFKRFPENIEAVGFRLFYTHARKNNNWKTLWPYLANLNVKIIHLRRENMLAQFLSLKRAMRSDVWVSIGKQSAQDDKSIWIDPEECSSYFVRMNWCQIRARKEFANSSMINISYEELSKAKDETSRKILNFLGLPYEQMSSPTRKQRKKPKFELIENYFELKELFSTWPTYFDD